MLRHKCLKYCPDILTESKINSWNRSSLTIGLNRSGSLDQVICELHGISRAERQITGQPDD